MTPAFLVVVDRYATALYKSLQERFAGDDKVMLFQDRRKGQRRRRRQMRHVDRRRGERRTRPGTDERLRSGGFFVTSASHAV